jgi:hypothetical protein
MDLVGVMAPVSHCRTLIARHLLIRNQLLTAMHETLGRPMFRPVPPEPLGVGVHWAFVGEQHQLNLHIPDDAPVTADEIMPPEVLCRMTQWAEAQFLTGPKDDDIETLRNNYGYKPETSAELTAERLEWETIYRELLKDDPISPAELRVRVQAREVAHEYVDLLARALQEYGLSIVRLFGGTDDGAARGQAVAFFDSMPSVHIAVDMKAALFRDTSRHWTMNDVHDIDFLSMAIPYCHVVVADKAAVSSVHQSGADVRCGTTVTRRMADLLDLLPPLEEVTRAMGGDHSGWDWCAPGVGFDPLSPDQFFGVKD